MSCSVKLCCLKGFIWFWCFFLICFWCNKIYYTSKGQTRNRPSGLLPRVPSKQSWKAAFQRFPHSKGRRVSSTTRPCTRELLRRLGLGIFWVLVELALELLAFQGFLFGCYRLLQYAFWLYDFACSALTGCLWTDAKPWWCLPCGMLLRYKLPRGLWVCSHTGQRQTFGSQELEELLLLLAFGISKLKLFCLESEMRSGRHHVATLVLCSRSLAQSQICQLCVSRFSLPWSSSSSWASEVVEWPSSQRLGKKVFFHSFLIFFKRIKGAELFFHGLDCFI